MMMHAWPALEPVPVLDLKELRSALATKDAARLVAAVAGRDIDDALQQVGSGMLLTLRQNHEYAEPLALSVINRLTWRGGPGDRILAEDLLATLRGVPLQGRVLPVDLEMLSILLEGAPELSTGAYLDLRTGAVYGGNETDPMMVGEDAAIDVDKEPDRWIYLAGVGSREGWRDMAGLRRAAADQSRRERLERAIEGGGAFRRFRDLAHDEGIAEQWDLFSSDRQLGRAREVLAAEGIRGARSMATSDE